jgi:hypothetical protein
VTTPTHRLLDAAAASQQHDEAVQHAAAVLATDRHPNLAQRLLDTWAAIGGDDPDADIRALPVEPGVGVTVEMGGRLAADWSADWALYQCRALESGQQVWQQCVRGGARLTWPELLGLAGPDGVRVLEVGNAQ